MSAEKHRRPSPLQRRGLIVLVALNAKRPGPVVTRDIERVLERGGDVPVYGPNLRASCRRMEAAGWLHTLRAPNLQLVVELTDAGRELAPRSWLSSRSASWRNGARRRAGFPWSRSGRWIPVTSGQAIGRSGWTTSGTWHAGAIMSSAPTEPPACSCGIRPDR